MGPITPVGTGVAAFWDGLVSGRSGVRRVDDRLDLDEIDVKIGAPVVEFDPLEHMDKRRARHLDRGAQFALAAAGLALKDASLDPGAVDPLRAGVIAGTGIGGLQTMEENFLELAGRGPRRVSPYFIPRLMPNAIAGEISIEFGFKGVNFGVVSACASGAHAIAAAAQLVAGGAVDVALAGGAEAVLVRIAYAGFVKIGALSCRNDEPERASRPFDKDRDGFVVGEGGGFVVLEAAEHAERRGAQILAELAGYGMTADAFHITAPCEDGDGAARAMTAALHTAGAAAEDVDYVNAHGTSTILNDVGETRAIRRALGSAADTVSISSTKSQIGHLLGAAGAVEAIATVLAMRHGRIPATVNLETPDPECDLDYTPITRSKRIDVAISNSFGFGGQNAVLLFRSV
ncbi:beta-ketoacyl-ACP synthase II [Candidatus Bipolaricaulota bacterium]|nr:beta-ketoacyl-ACP synthase II [Candidatus Bipolaricaulota bacterium]